jgi:hypothetical protein
MGELVKGSHRGLGDSDTVGTDRGAGGSAARELSRARGGVYTVDSENSGHLRDGSEGTWTGLSQNLRMRLHNRRLLTAVDTKHPWPSLAGVGR